MNEIKNEVVLANAIINYTIYLNREGKSQWSVNVELKPFFQTREEYMDFRREWKELYNRLTKAIRLTRPVAQGVHDVTMASYYRGKFHWPHAYLHLSLFLYRMQAKALLEGLRQAKIVAGKQREVCCESCKRRNCTCEVNVL